MIYLLDTNVCIHAINGRVPAIGRRLQVLKPDNIGLCAIVCFELWFGACRSIHPKKSRAIQQRFVGQFISLPFDDRAAEICARLRADLASKGTPIGPYDLQIAAIALAHDLTLVTHNVREFRRVVNLKFDDW